MTDKAEGAFKTIGEVSAELGIHQHILRYWETRFAQLRPVTRSGNRRYYRPSDVALVSRIHSLLGEQGYTVKGVQKLLSGKGEAAAPAPAPAVAAVASSPPSQATLLPQLRAIRDRLARALAEDDIAARA